jgi:hypothetical protein
MKPCPCTFLEVSCDTLYICHTQPTHQVTSVLLWSVTRHILEFRFQQDRWCIYKVTSRCSCNCCHNEEAISITYSECVYSLSYPACNAHAPYKLRPTWLYRIFAHYLIKGTIWGGRYWTQNVCWFFLKLSSEILLILGTEQGMVKNVYQSTCKVSVILVSILIKL